MGAFRDRSGKLQSKRRFYMANRIPSIINLGGFHRSLWYGKEANLSYIREIGCKAYVREELPDADQGEQLDPNVEESNLIG